MSARGPQRRALVLTALCLGAMAAFCAARLEVATEITHFLSVPGDETLGALSRRLAQSPLTRTLVLVVGTEDGDRDEAVDAAAELARGLARLPEVAWLSAGPDPGLAEAFRRVYFDRRFLFLSPEPERDIPIWLSDAGLDERAQRLKRELSLPRAPLMRAVAPSDPWLAFPALLDRLSEARGESLDVHRGGFVTADGRAVVFVRTRASAFDTRYQAPLLASVEEAFDALDRARGGGLELEWTGVQRFAVQAESDVRADVTRLSLLSTVGVVLLFLATFRSVRLLAVASLPLVAGLLAGLTVCLLVFDRIHGMTLAFGGALVGVCIDYPVHLLSHWVLDREGRSPREHLARIWPGVRLGAATSGVGFAALAAAGFPGIREIGVFSAAGIAAALATTRFAVPWLVESPAPRSRLLDRTAQTLEGVLESIRRARGFVIALLACVLALASIGLAGLDWTDDIAALSPIDPALAAEDERVRAQIALPGVARVVISGGDDEEAALQRTDRVAAKLVALREQGALAGFRSVHGFLWSESLQRRNAAALAAEPDLVARTRAALESHGFRGEAFAPFERDVVASAQPLTLQQIQASPLAPLVEAFRVPAAGESRGGAVAFATFISGLRDTDAVERMAASEDGVYFLDQRELLMTSYRKLRRAAVGFVGIGLLGVLALLAAHYRSPKQTAIALLPALLSAAVTLGLLAAFGTPITLVHVFGLLLVLSIGVDYGVFLAETARSRGSVGPTAAGVTVACLTSVLALGLLTISSNPALRALGLTTGIGVVLSLAFGFASLALLGSKERRA